MSSYYTPQPYRPNGTLSPTKQIRKLDTLAILTCLLLLRLAFTPDLSPGDVGASLELAFYSNFHSEIRTGGDDRAASPVSLDVDGDGVVDALVLPSLGGDGDDAHAWPDDRWGLRVLGLKPLQASGGETGVLPFAPETVLSSPLHPAAETAATTINEEDDDPVYPVQLLSIQIPISRTKLGEEERSRQRHKKADTSNNNGVVTLYGTNSAIPPKDEENSNYDRTRHYFCGKDWHHASSVCHRHCPGGVSSECNDGETCFADTPCDAMLPLEQSTTTTKKEEDSEMALTSRGTLPGITAIWSDGSVTLHVITADVTIASEAKKHEQQHRGKRERQKKKRAQLELRQLWRVHPLGTTAASANSTAADAVKFEELGLTYESGVIYNIHQHTNDKEQQQPGAHGAILLGGRYQTTKKTKVSFHALDALTGATLWDLDGATAKGFMTKKASSDNIPKIPIIHTTSSARRRSHLPVQDTMDSMLDNENSFLEGEDIMTSEECMSHFRHSVLEESNGALPHEFWEGSAGSLQVGRFERVRKSPGRKKKRLLNKMALLNRKDVMVGNRSGGGERAGGGTIGVPRGREKRSGGWQTDFLQRAVPRRLLNRQKYDANHPKMGKPNVVLFHGRDGLAVLSLKNGRPVCHISLIDNALYADIDKDGVVDVVQIITASDESRSNLDGLISRINKSEDGGGDDAGNKNEPSFCHALVTSGLPPREEVFTAPLCLGGPMTSTDRKLRQLRAAPPLLVEGSLGYGNDVVFAMNNGVIVRYDANGREMWRKKAAKDGTPSWHSDSVLLGRVQFGSIKSHSSVSASSHANKHRHGSPARPILISGEDGAALISPANGKVLAYVAYPQSAISQPLLVDLNGDGTDDLCVVSKDAIWGYRIIVETGRSGFFAIVVVTLVVGVALSALIHKTSQTSRRSMDA